VKVSCLGCGNLFETSRNTAKTCSVTCRKRASRAGLTTVPPRETPDFPEKPLIHPLVVQTTQELEEAGVLESVHGQIALALAEKLSVGNDTGSAMASLARQLSAAMSEALAGGTKKADSLDELAERRWKKAAG
jgi:hypothetical protein